MGYCEILLAVVSVGTLGLAGWCVWLLSKMALRRPFYLVEETNGKVTQVMRMPSATEQETRATAEVAPTPPFVPPDDSQTIGERM